MAGPKKNVRARQTPGPSQSSLGKRKAADYRGGSGDEARKERRTHDDAIVLPSDEDDGTLAGSDFDPPTPSRRPATPPISYTAPGSSSLESRCCLECALHLADDGPNVCVFEDAGAKTCGRCQSKKVSCRVVPEYLKPQLNELREFLSKNPGWNRAAREEADVKQKTLARHIREYKKAEKVKKSPARDARGGYYEHPVKEMSNSAMYNGIMGALRELTDAVRALASAPVAPVPAVPARSAVDPRLSGLSPRTPQTPARSLAPAPVVRPAERLTIRRTTPVPSSVAAAAGGSSSQGKVSAPVLSDRIMPSREELEAIVNSLPADYLQSVVDRAYEPSAE